MAQQIPDLQRRPVVTEPTRLYGNQALNYTSYTPIAPSSAPSLAGPPPLPSEYRPPAVGVNAWALAQKNRYFELEQQVLALAGIEQQVAHAEQLVARHTARQEAESVLANARGALSALEKKVQKAEHASMRKVLNAKKYHAKIAEKNAQYAKAHAAEEEAQQRVVAETRALEAPTRQARELQGRLAQKRVLDAEMQQILRALFEGYAAGDPAENGAEEQVRIHRALQPQIEAALSDQRTALAHITNAVGAIEKMFRTLKGALLSNTVDMFSDGFLGAMSGLATNMQMMQAKEMGKVAQQEIQLALRYSPYMPAARNAKVGFSNLLMFTNILFDNVFLDIYQQFKITEQLRKLEVPYQDAVNNMAWLEQFVRNIDRDKASNVQALSAAEHRLIGERVRLIHTLDFGAH